MPLIKSPTEIVRRINTLTELRAGKSLKQALAIGYSVQRIAKSTLIKKKYKPSKPGSKKKRKR